MALILGQDYSLLKSYKVTRDYKTYKVTKGVNSLIIHYFTDDNSSSWIKDPETFQKFPQTYEVISGGWYGDHGRWKTVKRIVREIKCSNVSNYEESAISGTSKIYIDKPFFSKNINIKIECEKLPTMKFICSEFSFTDFFQIMLVDKQAKKYIDCTDLFEGGLNYVGVL